MNILIFGILIFIIIKTASNNQVSEGELERNGLIIKHQGDT